MSWKKDQARREWAAFLKLVNPNQSGIQHVPIPDASPSMSMILSPTDAAEYGEKMEDQRMRNAQVGGDIDYSIHETLRIENGNAVGSVSGSPRFLPISCDDVVHKRRRRKNRRLQRTVHLPSWIRREIRCLAEQTKTRVDSPFEAKTEFLDLDEEPVDEIDRIYSSSQNDAYFENLNICLNFGRKSPASLWETPLPISELSRAYPTSIWGNRPNLDREWFFYAFRRAPILFALIDVDGRFLEVSDGVRAFRFMHRTVSIDDFRRSPFSESVESIMPCAVQNFRRIADLTCTFYDSLRKSSARSIVVERTDARQSLSSDTRVPEDELASVSFPFSLSVDISIYSSLAPVLLEDSLCVSQYQMKEVLPGSYTRSSSSDVLDKPSCRSPGDEPWRLQALSNRRSTVFLSPIIPAQHSPVFVACCYPFHFSCSREESFESEEGQTDQSMSLEEMFANASISEASKIHRLIQRAVLPIIHVLPTSPYSILSHNHAFESWVQSHAVAVSDVFENTDDLFSPYDVEFPLWSVLHTTRHSVHVLFSMNSKRLAQKHAARFSMNDVPLLPWKAFIRWPKYEAIPTYNLQVSSIVGPTSFHADECASSESLLSFSCASVAAFEVMIID